MKMLGYNTDVSFLQKSLPGLVEVYASQVLNDRPDLTEEDQWKESARVYLAAAKSGKLRELVDSWDVLPGLRSIQTFQEHVLPNICALHVEYSMFSLALHLQYRACLQVRRVGGVFGCG